MDRHGNRPGIQGKLPVKNIAGGSTGFLSLSFLSLEDALFLLCPWFSHEVFYMVMSFNEASEDTGIFPHFSSCCCLFLYWPFHFLLLCSFASSVGGEVSE